MKNFKCLICTVCLSFCFALGSASALQQWEKDVLADTQDVKRIPAGIAYQMYLTGDAFVASVDPAAYFKQKRIVESVNIPWKKFTEKFINRNKSKFKKYKYIILY